MHVSIGLFLRMNLHLPILLLQKLNKPGISR